MLARHGFRRFSMSRTPVGHLALVAHFDGKPVETVLDTGAGKTFVELTFCRAANFAVIDTGQPSQTGTVHVLNDATLALEGMPLRTDGIFALDMSNTNERLKARGVDPIRACIGQDVLRYHRAVIDYATLSLYLMHLTPGKEADADVAN